MRKRIMKNDVLLLAIFLWLLLSLTACIEMQSTEEQDFSLWQDLNITYLKQPKILMLTSREKEEALTKLDAIEAKLEAEKPFNELSYSNISLLFADFLKEKLALFESKDAYFLFEVLPEKDLRKASEQDCNRMLAFSSFISKLETLSAKAKVLNNMIKKFSQRYANQAKQSDINLLLVDEKALEDTKRKSELAIFSGKLCALNRKAEKFFETISITSVDCNALPLIKNKIDEARALNAEADKLFEEALSYALDVETLMQGHANIQNSLSELERLYTDISNSC